MRKKICKHGNGRAITLEKAILELLKIDDNTELEISTDGRGIHIYPVEREEFEQAKKRGLKRQAKPLKALAQM